MNNLAIKYVIIFFILLTTGVQACSKAQVKHSPSDTTADVRPALSGRLLFHAYTCYTCNDSRFFLYDFATSRLDIISDSWNIVNPMNAHFSPDGKTIVFMGVTPGMGWDVFKWEIGSSAAPQSLTASFGAARDEDPKYSHDGSRIIFKQNGLIKEMDTLGNIIRTITVAHTEASMPFYAKGDSIVFYSGNETGGSTGDIYMFSLNTNQQQPLSAIAGVEEYYPIARDDTSFLFTRWYSSTNRNDQVYLGFMNGRTAHRLSFNEPDQNYSDAYPVSDRYVILSSTRTGGKGGYDLYLADMQTGERWSLSLYGSKINSAKNELGACYVE